MQPLTTCLWFDTQAEQAALFYASVFPEAEMGEVVRYTEAGPGPAGSVLTASWRIGDSHFFGVNGGPVYTLSPAVSFQIPCADQAEVDYYWDALTAEGGEPGQCGWLTDRFGVSWQVTPVVLTHLLADSDRERAKRVTEVMLKMGKLVIADLEAAAESR